MTTPEFVHLHVHSHASLLDGFSKAPEYLAKAKSLGMRGLGITDHGNTFGSYDLVNTARAADMIGIPGCEFYVAPINPEGARVKKPVYYGPNGQKADGGKDVAGRRILRRVCTTSSASPPCRTLKRTST
jgi:DNA polymerase-3 subunit alpha